MGFFNFSMALAAISLHLDMKRKLNLYFDKFAGLQNFWKCQERENIKISFCIYQQQISTQLAKYLEMLRMENNLNPNTQTIHTHAVFQLSFKIYENVEGKTKIILHHKTKKI